ncbi:MAG: SpoIID/LytB domain-containing protein [Candidatus Riflebacteria bacterium]|nr:SpoIID/LytB domain-containing protein [Candidatus Riflebacteria bacterium]
MLKIGLVKNLGEIDIKIPFGGDLRDIYGRKAKIFKNGDDFHWSLSAEVAFLNQQAKSKNRKQKKFEGFIGKKFYIISRGPLTFKGKSYQGIFLLFFKNEGVQIINFVRLEDYTKGVLRGEIGSLAPIETLKTQAILARTYGMANLKKHGSDGFDLCASEHCQVYLGASAERPSITQAVDSTRGIVMGYGSQLASPMYHSTCGGYTTSNDEVYGGKAVPYLRRVKCDYCSKGINYRWTRLIPNDLLKKRLASEKIFFNRIYSATVESPAQLDRVKNVVIVTDRGRFSVKGTTFRRIFSLPSSTFMVSGLSEDNSKLALRADLQVPLASKQGKTSFEIIPVLADLSKINGKDPAGFIIASRNGLKRIARPKGGWKVIIAGVQSNFSRKSIPEKGLDIKSPGRVLLNKGQSTGEALLRIIGRGYGHQIGMCQSGAIEQGKLNWSYRRILPFYYHGVCLMRLRY